jgi:hypothetical protein
MATTKGVKTTRNSKEPARPRGGPAGLKALAERICPHKTDGVLRNALVPPGDRRLKPDEARTCVIDRVAAVVSKTCDWGRPVMDWHIGDHRFLVLEFWPARNVCLYVQIWTEPDDPVLVEVCSGAWNPTARPYVGPRQRAALRRLGYAVGGRARNYQKYWTLSPLADTRALAAELVTVLVDVLGYRGRRALQTVYCSEARTEEGRVFPGLAIDDVKRMLQLGGGRVVTAEPVGPVTPGLKKRLIHVDQPFPFVVEMRARSGKTPETHEAMRLVTVLPGGRGLSPRELEMMVRECPFGRIFRDNEGDLLLIQDLLVAGTTVRWFLMTLHIWKTTRERAVEMLRLTLAPPAPGGRRTPGGSGEDGDPDDIDVDDDGDEGDTGDGDGDGEPRQSRSARTVVH